MNILLIVHGSNSWLGKWVLKLLKVNATLIDKTYLERLVNVLLNIIPNYTDVALKGLMCMGTNLPEVRAEEVIDVVMQRVDTDADKIDALYFLKSVKIILLRRT